MKKHKDKPSLKDILRLALLVFCGAILGFNVYLANAKNLVGNQLPMPFGYGAAVVLSGSMEPELSKGDLIVVRKIDTLTINQIVVFQDEDSLVAHRIVDIGDDKIVTKGDANNVSDDPVDKSQILGQVVFSVPYFGSVIELVKTPVGTTAILLVAILLLEIPRLREMRTDTEEIEKIKEEIKRLKSENE